MAGEVTVKREPTLDLQNRIILLCTEHPKGITDELIQKYEPQADAHQRVNAANQLLQQGKLEVLRKASGKAVYRLKTSNNASQLKGIEIQDRVVYQVIESAGNKGIWTKEIRHKSNLMVTEVNKILKNLEVNKHIKAVKSVTASKRKVYMLYNLEPDRSITGGPWYSDSDFESEYVEVLNQQCFKFLQQKEENAANESSLCPSLRHRSTYASSEEVLHFISELGISKEKLQLDDIETILNTLIYDGKIELLLVPSKNGVDKLYRSVKSFVEAADVTRSPCSVCPVFDKCRPGGVISPEKCVYMTEWMEY